MGKEYQARKKEEARKVLDRMLSGQTKGLKTVVYQSWMKIVQEEKSVREAEARLMEANGQMTLYQQKKKEEAKAVFARVAAANDSGLLDTCLTAWYRIMLDVKAEKEAEKKIMAETEKLSEWQKKKKEDAKRVFTRMAAA